jgi:hypothetical protein
MSVIEDGTGTGTVAKVNNTNRLYTDAVNRSQSQQAILQGNGYNVNTGPITLTSANESAVFYFKYTGNRILIIKEILAIVGGTTGGSGEGILSIIKNPTTGTIISSAVDVNNNVNRNFASANTLSALAYKGDEADTITNGITFANSSRSSFGTVIAFDADIIVLEKGNSIGVNFTPPTSNTSQEIRIALSVFEEIADVT